MSVLTRYAGLFALCGTLFGFSVAKGDQQAHTKRKIYISVGNVVNTVYLKKHTGSTFEVLASGAVTSNTPSRIEFTVSMETGEDVYVFCAQDYAGVVKVLSSQDSYSIACN